MNNSGFVVWLYGLPCSGKSTIAEALVSRLSGLGRNALWLDGDVLRAGLCADLNFSPEGRHENIRRAAHVARLAMQAGLPVIVSLVTPRAALRDLARSVIGPERLQVVAVSCPVEECQRRDVRGLYAKAAAGLMKGMTGVDDVFEGAADGEFRVDTLAASVDDCVEQVIRELSPRGLWPA